MPQPADGGEVWFVTGSQEMYGEDVLAQVAAQSQEVCRLLDSNLPAPRLVWKPVMTSADAIRRACPDATADDNVIGVLAWIWRLQLATGDPRYADLIERTLFNVIATSPSRAGTAFDDANTLHQRRVGAPADPDAVSPRASSSLRAPWFEVSCCPPNVARTLASLAALVATVDDDGSSCTSTRRRPSTPDECG